MLTYVNNSTYFYIFDSPIKNVKPAQPELANRIADST